MSITVGVIIIVVIVTVLMSTVIATMFVMVLRVVAAAAAAAAAAVSVSRSPSEWLSEPGVISAHAADPGMWGVEALGVPTRNFAFHVLRHPTSVCGFRYGGSGWGWVQYAVCR